MTEGEKVDSMLSEVVESAKLSFRRSESILEKIQVVYLIFGILFLVPAGASLGIALAFGMGAAITYELIHDAPPDNSFMLRSAGTGALLALCLWVWAFKNSFKRSVTYRDEAPPSDG